MKNDRTQETIADIIEKQLGFTNGWSVSHDTYRDHCDVAAKKILAYLKRKERNKKSLNKI